MTPDNDDIDHMAEADGFLERSTSMRVQLNEDAMETPSIRASHDRVAIERAIAVLQGALAEPERLVGMSLLVAIQASAADAERFAAHVPDDEHEAVQINCVFVGTRTIMSQLMQVGAREFIRQSTSTTAQIIPDELGL